MKKCIFVLKNFSVIFLFIFTFVAANNINYGMGKVHYLKNDWYDENKTGVKKANVTSITFKEEDDEISSNDYEYLWELDNNGLIAYFADVTDVVISIPHGDTLKLDRNASYLFSFYNQVYIDSDGEEHFTETFENPDSIIKSSLTKIENLSMLDTSNVEDMSYMFWNLNSIEELDLTNFNTDRVNNMSHMFSGMNKLKNIDISTLNTQNVTNMSGLFSELESLKSLDIKTLDTKNVKDMSEMFKDMAILTDLDISRFDTSRLKSANKIFSGCKSLKNLKINNLSLEYADNNVRNMFEGCDNLTNVDFSNVKLPKKIDYLFSGINAKSLEINGIDTKNVISMSNLFSNSKRLEQLKISLTTENVEDMSWMFANCENLENLSVKFDTQNAKYMQYMFYNCKSLKEIATKEFNTENVEDMRSMFAKCRDLKKLDLSKFNTKKVEPNCLYEMLSNLRALEELDISGSDFVLNYVDKSYSKNDKDYSELYNFSLKDLSSLKKIKMNEEVARRTYDLILYGDWRNVKTNAISSISESNSALNSFTAGEYELVPSCRISFEPKNILKMYDMNFRKGDSLNTETDILAIDEYNNVYYNEGYSFSGWYLDKNFQNRVPKVLKIDSDTTLYARVEVKPSK